MDPLERGDQRWQPLGQGHHLAHPTVPQDVALVTDKPHPEEIHYPSLKLWATSPDTNRNRTEWIRFAPDSPLGKTPVGRMPHVAFLVDDMDKQLEGRKVVAGPVQVTEKLRVAYFIMDGLLVEYMEGDM